ncbi:hypothetical protein [Fusobacterium sp. IOR10]|uniref:hypothetical protein n=1 Tax=Fusobacterium sp. IOR10 TaxID=2665157 RepID=UPI0013D68555|nr:hypothetical protein [Fusobacterium sp. IOR10]
MKKSKMLGLGIFVAFLLVGCSNMYNNDKEELGTMMMKDQSGQMMMVKDSKMMMQDGKMMMVKDKDGMMHKVMMKDGKMMMDDNGTMSEVMMKDGKVYKAGY